MIIVNITIDNIKITWFIGISRTPQVLHVLSSSYVIELHPSDFAHRYKQENLNDFFLLIHINFLAILFELNIQDTITCMRLFDIFIFFHFPLFYLHDDGILIHQIAFFLIRYQLRRHICLNLWILIFDILWNFIGIHLLSLYVLRYF